MAKLKVGIIGCGMLGVHHARKFTELEETEVVALSDPSAQAMESAAEVSNTSALRCADYRDLLDAGLDAVCIASPDGFHVAQILDALAANLHVLCEKPLSNRPADVAAVVAARDEADKVVALTYPRRYDPGLQRMREEILSGRWGKVTAVMAYNAEEWYNVNKGTWRHDPALCPGGFFYDANGHQLDAILWATGLRHEWVKANFDLRGSGVPIWAWGTAQLTGGVPMTFSFIGDAHKWRESVNIHTEGMDFVLEKAQAMWVQDGKLAPMSDQPWQSATEAFVDMVLRNGPNLTPPEGVLPLQSFTNDALASGGIVYGE